MTPWIAGFSTSATTDKILSFIKSVSFRLAGRLLRTDILLFAISAFTTSMWIIEEVEQERLPRNLNILNRGKISPAGRNDTNSVSNFIFNGDIAKLILWGFAYLILHKTM